jgi:hypothetical protein
MWYTVTSFSGALGRLSLKILGSTPYSSSAAQRKPGSDDRRNTMKGGCRGRKGEQQIVEVRVDCGSPNPKLLVSRSGHVSNFSSHRLPGSGQTFELTAKI